KFGLLWYSVGDLDRHRAIKEVSGRPQETELINRVLEVDFLVVVRLEGTSHLPIDQPLIPSRLVHPHPVDVTLEAPPPAQRNLEVVLNHRPAAPVLPSPPLPRLDVLQGATGYLNGLRRNLINGVPSSQEKFLIDDILIDER